VAAGVQNHLFAHEEQRKGYFYARFEFEQGEGDNHIVVIKMGRIKKKSAVARTKSRAGGKFQSAMALLQKELMKMACCNVSEDWEDLSGEDIECENEDNIECETLDDIECDQSNECNVTAVLNEALQWNSAAVVAILRGDSARSIRRHKQKAVQLKQSAGKQGTIYKYLIPCPVQQEVLEERQGVLEEPIAAQQLLEIEQANVADLHIDLQIYGEDDLAADEGEHMEGKLTMQEAVEELSLSDARFTNNGRDEKAVKGTRRFAFIQSLAVMRYFQRRLDGVKRMDAAESVAKQIYNKDGRHSYRARCIRQWSTEYLQTGKISESQQGRHAKTNSIILQEPVKHLFVTILQAMNARRVVCGCTVPHAAPRWYAEGTGGYPARTRYSLAWRSSCPSRTEHSPGFPRSARVAAGDGGERRSHDHLLSEVPLRAELH
jgi:hypothetical protein